jgi:GT2 family glycosyltransferase
MMDVVVVSFRCEPMLRECLESLRRFPASSEMAVHVVDNASKDGTAEMVAREFPEVNLTASDENLGFGAANNLVIRASTAPYILCLNPDTRATEGALDRLIEVMDERVKLGICGPRLELEDGSFDHAAKRSFPTPLSALGHFTGIGRRRGSGVLAAYRAPEVDAGPVDAINGACMLFRRSALEEVGPFDEGYWMYMEDLDLCYRFDEARWVTWYEPSATVVHVKAGTTGPVRAPRLTYAFHYGMYRFYRKHYAAQKSRIVNAVVYSGIALKAIGSVINSAAKRTVRATD